MNIRNQRTMPANRVHHCMTSVCEFVIIYGGCENNTGAVCNELLSFNTISGIWKHHYPPIEIKDTCLSSSICSVGNLVYIFGGDCFDDHQYRQTNSIVSFDITNSTWNVVYPHTNNYDPNTPPPMCCNYLLYNNGSLYVFGDTIYRFCLKSLTWFLMPQNGLKPTYNRQIFGTVYKNRIYCFEPPQAEKTRFKDIFIFDLSTLIWTSRSMSSRDKQYPDDRHYESWAFSGNVGFMSGGIRPYTTYKINSDIWRIDLECVEWRKLENSLNPSVYDHSMAVIDDSYLYSFGGYHNECWINTLERFTVQPPTLYRLCLESICQSPNLRNYTKILPAAIADELNFNGNNSSLDQ
ncbi:Kelch domain-containing protein 10 [Thelohanellus kitauei]|uniref:Kelch domain-containing protein 10 n=1 Tax=Thelohanellus kitauei TaxID=669202 RepID=A0A0C2M7L5_THEKT|nr:Kelch domain-containing protein 10 [Thelohanellus kitauei]